MSRYDRVQGSIALHVNGHSASKPADMVVCRPPSVLGNIAATDFLGYLPAEGISEPQLGLFVFQDCPDQEISLFAVEAF
jgi:hypothetical protein